MKTNSTQRVKLLLLSGKKLTVQQLDKKLKTNNSAEIIRRVRRDIDVGMKWRKNRKTKKRYGVYFYIPKPKVDRIKTREYLNQY